MITVAAYLAVLFVTLMLGVFTLEEVMELGLRDRGWQQKVLLETLDQVEIGEAQEKEFSENLQEMFVRGLERVR